MEIRRRLVKPEESEVPSKISENIKHLDIFPKLPDKCVYSSKFGGFLSLITAFVIISLSISEIGIYMDPEINFSYSVDHGTNRDITLNVDIAVATACSLVNMDIVDLSGRTIKQTATLKKYPIMFDMPPHKYALFEMQKSNLDTLKQRAQSLKDFFWKRRFWQSSLFPPFKLEIGPEDHYETPLESEVGSTGCRFVGFFKVGKVPGNLHILLGEPTTFFNSHIHLVSNEMAKTKANYSHRIHHLFMGDLVPNQIHPLQGEEKISTNDMGLFKYFIQAVSTNIHTPKGDLDAYQYGVTELMQVGLMDRTDRNPGIFFVYDFFPLKVSIDELGNRSLIHLLLRLVAITSGIFVTMGVLRNFLLIASSTVYDLIFYRDLRKLSHTSLIPSHDM